MKYLENKMFAKKMFHIKIVEFNECIKRQYTHLIWSSSMEELSKLTLKFLMEIYTVVQYSYRH